MMRERETTMDITCHRVTKIEVAYRKAWIVEGPYDEIVVTITDTNGHESEITIYGACNDDIECPKGERARLEIKREGGLL